MNVLDIKEDIAIRIEAEIIKDYHPKNFLAYGFNKGLEKAAQIARGQNVD